MSLAAYQTAVGRLIRARNGDGMPQDQLRGLELDDNERCAVAALLGGRGLRFTREVQRSWCKGRARNAALLTLSLMREDERQFILDEWVELGGGVASFFAGEADVFLEFIAVRMPLRSHRLSVCRMEQAVHRAKSIDVFGAVPALLADDLRATTMICRAPGATLVDFHAEPDLLLAAVRSQAALPPYSDDAVSLFFGAELPQLFELAEEQEAVLWRRLDQPAALGVLQQERHPDAVIERLISLGLICPIQEEIEAA